MKIEATIIAPGADYVKTNSQQRIHRAPLAAQAIAPALKALARHIAKRQRKHQPVRIPAMTGRQWGEVLRTLELKRAYA
jgi:hypothetical protein